MRLEKENGVHVRVSWRHQGKATGTSFMVYDVPENPDIVFFTDIAAQAAGQLSPTLKPNSYQVKVEDSTMRTVYSHLVPEEFVAAFKQKILEW